MSRVFAIGDPHLGHRKAAQLRGFASSEQHDRAFVEAWNRTVTKRDVVYVLGDVFKLDLVPLLHGTKKLALGNHDKRPIRAYIDLFSQVHAMFEFDGCLLTHVPVNESQRYRYDLNVHGHTHAKHLDDDWFVPVSVEHCPRMEPLPLRELIQARRERLRHRPVGRPGERDPENPCVEFLPGSPAGQCLGDGHYLCNECDQFRRQETES